jgi:hypothetical protein
MKLFLNRTTAALFALRSPAQTLFTALVLVALIGLEWTGRTAKTDVQDIVYALFLLGLCGVVAVWHRRRPLVWVDWAMARGSRLFRWTKALRYDHGIDFRGSPAFPNRIPLSAWFLGFGLIFWAAVGVLVWEWVPGGWRAVGVKTSYLLYLTVMVVVWMVLLTGLMGGLFLPLMTLDRRLQNLFGDSDRRLVVFVLSVSYLFVVTAAAAFVPVVAPLAVCAVAVGVAFGWAARSDQSQIAILWRGARNGVVYAVPIHRAIAGGAGLLLLAFVALLINGRCGRLLTHVEPTDTMPLTASLAALVAWTVPGLIAFAFLRIREKQRNDPANRTPTRLHLQNRLSVAAGELATRTIASWSWNVTQETGRARTEDLSLELVHPELSEATEFDPQWPLKVTPTDLENPLVKDRLIRRDEIHLRRQLFRGLNKLIKRGVEVRKEKGGGFWLAPHWWFIEGLGREDGGKSRRTDDGSESELLRRIGPPFSEVFGERPRQHLHQVLRAVQIDVIYIEDGVPLKSLTKVLRAVFEIYDVHAGKKIVDDHSFQGIPKVRCMVHEFSPTRTIPPVSHYRQPKFDDLSRGRVLHIFRDKGEYEEVIETPRDFDYVPSPALVG